MSDDTYRTTDWNQIVYLLVEDVPLAETVRVAERRVEFVFHDRELCEKLTMEFALQQTDDAVIASKTLNAIRGARLAIHRTPPLG